MRHQRVPRGQQGDSPITVYTVFQLSTRTQSIQTRIHSRTSPVPSRERTCRCIYIPPPTYRPFGTPGTQLSINVRHMVIKNIRQGRIYSRYPWTTATAFALSSGPKGQSRKRLDGHPGIENQSKPRSSSLRSDREQADCA